VKIDWTKYKGTTLNVTLHENYGVEAVPQSNEPFYEIVFKVGNLIEVYDDGLLLETKRENRSVRIFIPFGSIKCVEIYNF
jgi:hypothetical protein